MARGLVSLTSTGLKEFIKEMEELADAIPQISIKALAAQQKVVEGKIKANWVTLAGGKSGDYVYSSVGQSTAFSQSDPNTVIGTVGVYKINKIHTSFGRTSKDLNAAQIAYWVEFGTSRLKSGVVKKRNEEYKEEDLITIAAKPFVSNALYSSLNEQYEAFKIEFNKQADRYRYTG